MEPYRSTFDNWNERASVRTKPRRSLDDPHDVKLFFPPEFVPAVSHPLVAARGPEAARRILLHSLYQYLHFTTVLEQVAVLPVTCRISTGISGIDVPAAMRTDAFKITTDEAWHAQSAHEFISHVSRAVEVPADTVVEPRFVRRLSEVRETFDVNSRYLVDLMFAVVSETLVSGLLSDIPKDHRLPGPVRAIVADHAADEGRHHAYFRKVLERVWPQLSLQERRMIAPRVPEFIRTFLDPDKAAVASALTATGFLRPDIDEILRTSYHPEAVLNTTREASQATVRSFSQVGAMEDPEVQDAFQAAGLSLAR
ncbi:diiron oxygenase [Micromonospora ureilytica]|uniref:diiron oxygenase n=1 Tax=Micromonospora ureilytica TaxID=709868 RepID=UPI002E0DBF95|nr:diiron oxygenase [Micromonospora ureilytica]